jgi:hypothetical protein
MVKKGRGEEEKLYKGIKERSLERSGGLRGSWKR